MFKHHLAILPLFLPFLFASPTPLPLPTSTLSTDYTSLGYLVALNASAPYFPGAGPVAGCMTSSFTWTLDANACGLFDGARTVYNASIGMWMYGFESREGVCGLAEGGRVTCSGTGVVAGSWSAPNSTVSGVSLYMLGWANWPVQTWPREGIDVDVWNTLVSDPVPGVLLEGFAKSFSLRWRPA
ncbi:hypothetical protein MFRU_007g03580 [Monilinia fructicola]|nr:hypothetical protein MFRU_007g03580 [Monilinia fructicola]